MNTVAAVTWEVRRLSVAEYPPVKLLTLAYLMETLAGRGELVEP
jgi:hypothetical protein